MCIDLLPHTPQTQSFKFRPFVGPEKSYARGAQHTARGPNAASWSCVSGPHDLPQHKLACLIFQAHIFFVNLWQLLMVLFQFTPNSGIFGGFQLLGSPQVSKCTISTFSAEINNRKSCCHMRFTSSKYTKMRLWGPYSTPPDLLATGGEGPRCPLKTHRCSRPYRPSVFRPSASKKLCIPVLCRNIALLTIQPRTKASY